VDFIYPEGFLVEGVESQGKTDEQTTNENKEFSLFSRIQISKMDAHQITLLSPIFRRTEMLTN
jgi:hypothetical protein